MILLVSMINIIQRKNHTNIFLQELCSLKKALGVPYNRLSQNACTLPEGQGQAALGPQGMGSEAISQLLGGQQEGHSLLP